VRKYPVWEGRVYQSSCGEVRKYPVWWIGELLFKAPLPYGRGVWGEGFTSKGEPVNLPLVR